MERIRSERAKRAAGTAAAVQALLLTSMALAAPGQAQGYGAAVAVADEALLVGEPERPLNPGAVYVYRRGEGGRWEETQRLTAPAAAEGDAFGSLILPTGSELLIGAPGYEEERGALVVFRQEADGTWHPVGAVAPDGLEPEAGFGARGTVEGNTALVSTRPGEGRAARIYELRRIDGNWQVTDALEAPDLSPTDLFGSSLLLFGDRAFVGAMGRRDRSGTVLVYRRDGSGGWTAEASLEPSDATRNLRFGASLALHGDLLLVGAPGFGRALGAVYVFARDEESGEWQEVGRLLPFDGPGFAQFGSSLAVRGEELWVGAPGASRFEGRIYRLRQDPESGDWAVATKLAPADVARGDRFGAAIALGDRVAAVGVTGDDYGAGTVAVFERSGDDWREAHKVWSETEGWEAVVGGEVRCTDGVARGFDCGDVDLLAFLPVRDLGGARGVRLNDIWGWTDPETGREYAIVGRLDGTSFVDVTDPLRPVYLGNLPKTEGSPGSTWRDMKVYRNHVFIVADGAERHGMQVFDLTRLRDVREPPVTFTENAHYDRIHSAHNIVINPETGFAFVVGASAGGDTCGGGLHMIDIREPTRPAFAGCFADAATGRQRTGYTHDAQCVLYRGPDEAYRGREICFGSNETALSIADVTDKAHPQPLAVAQYPNVGYTHQGWLTEDQRYFFMDDELDEIRGFVDRTRTLVWDVSDLDDPVLVKEFFGTTGASDHNLYVRGRYVYQSNYVAGLRVLDIRDPEHPVEVAHFDTVPYGENAPGFGGSWSNYPFFGSGVIVVTSGREGLFVLRTRETEPVP